MLKLEAKPILLQASNLATIPWLRHAFTTRIGGRTTAYSQPDDLNLGLTPADQPATVQSNRQALLAAVTQPPPEPWTLLNARQTHSTHIATIPELPQPQIEADGLLTALPRVALAILTADCVPVLVADTRLRIVAAFHAGWRGTAARIVQQGVHLLRDQHASRPEDLLAAIGPSIGPCCYQVGEEVRTAFQAEPTLIQDDRLDLWAANRAQLLASGLPAENIEILAQCTACTFTPTGRRLFFSHRAEHGHTGRMMSLIGIAPTPPTNS